MSKTVTSIIDIFTGFVGHYADEAATLATALTSMLSGLALPPSVAVEVETAIAVFKKAADNLANFTPPTPAEVVVAESDIERVVAAVLPGVVKELVDKAVNEALSSLPKPNTAPEADPASKAPDSNA